MRGVTDAYVGGFWWNTMLGELGMSGHAFACRQSLVGGAYPLIDLARRQPLPDFYSTLLWHRLAGSRALRLSVQRTYGKATPEREAITYYARCARWESKYSTHAYGGTSSRPTEGGVLVVALNLMSKSARFIVEGVGGSKGRRLDFVLTAGPGHQNSTAAMLMQQVHFNGAELRVWENRTYAGIPSLVPQLTAGSAVRLPRWSYGFFLWPDAKVGACASAKTRAKWKAQATA